MSYSYLDSNEDLVTLGILWTFEKRGRKGRGQKGGALLPANETLPNGAQTVSNS